MRKERPRRREWKSSTVFGLLFIATVTFAVDFGFGVD